MIAREIVDDLEAALEQFRETIKSSLWVPGQARNDEFLEFPIGRNARGSVFMRLFRRCACGGGMTGPSANTTEPKEFGDLRFAPLLQQHRSASTFQLSGLMKTRRHVRTAHITQLVEQPRACSGWRGQLAIVVHGRIPIT
jgi:hypothetical protein